MIDPTTNEVNRATADRAQADLDWWVGRAVGQIGRARFLAAAVAVVWRPALLLALGVGTLALAHALELAFGSGADTGRADAIAVPELWVIGAVALGLSLLGMAGGALALVAGRPRQRAVQAAWRLDRTLHLDEALLTLAEHADAESAIGRAFLAAARDRVCAEQRAQSGRVPRLVPIAPHHRRLVLAVLLLALAGVAAWLSNRPADADTPSSSVADSGDETDANADDENQPDAGDVNRPENEAESNADEGGDGEGGVGGDGQGQDGGDGDGDDGTGGSGGDTGDDADGGTADSGGDGDGGSPQPGGDEESDAGTGSGDSEDDSGEDADSNDGEDGDTADGDENADDQETDTDDSDDGSDSESDSTDEGDTDDQDGAGDAASATDPGEPVPFKVDPQAIDPDANAEGDTRLADAEVYSPSDDDADPTGREVDLRDLLPELRQQLEGARQSGAIADEDRDLVQRYYEFLRRRAAAGGEDDGED